MTSIIEDTRQKAGKHENKRRYWDQEGDHVIRSSLPFGDYALAPTVSVDTKEDIKEIGSNMCGAAKEKKRFREECKAAKEAGCRLVFLIEDPGYKDVTDLYGKKIWLYSGQVLPGDQLATAMGIMSERYGCEFRFCDPADTGRIIKEILLNE